LSLREVIMFKMNFQCTYYFGEKVKHNERQKESRVKLDKDEIR